MSRAEWQPFVSLHLQIQQRPEQARLCDRHFWRAGARLPAPAGGPAAGIEQLQARCHELFIASLQNRQAGRQACKHAWDTHSGRAKLLWQQRIP